jgi:hypothetical protein
MAATPDGGGYWLVAADGGIFSFGDAAFHGSGAGTISGTQAVAVTATHDHDGYRIARADGHVITEGDAPTSGA